jgi:hypothetical protein
VSEFQYLDGGNTEAQDRLASSYLFAQDSAGLATDGVLSGLAVAQTTTASASVTIAAGACAVQDSVLSGVALLVNDSQKTLDVLGANPMGGTPRNDLVVFDAATVSGGTGGLRVIVGTPNAVPADPSVPATAVKLARIRNLASATTVPAAQIDDLRSYTSLFGARVQGKRSYWASYTTGNTDASGYVTVTHGAGFTPSVVNVTAAVTTYASNHADAILTVDSFTSTSFRLRAVKSETGAVFSGQSYTISAFLGE